MKKALFINAPKTGRLVSFATFMLASCTVGGEVIERDAATGSGGGGAGSTGGGGTAGDTGSGPTSTGVGGSGTTGTSTGTGGMGTGGVGTGGSTGGAAGMGTAGSAAGSGGMGTGGSTGGAAGLTVDSGAAGSGGMGTGGSTGGNAGQTVDAGGQGGATMPDAPMEDVPAILRGLRKEIPCKYGNASGGPLLACNTGDICWLEGEQNGGASKWPSSVTIGGDPAVTYEIVLRVRGVIEPKDYNAQCVPQFTGAIHVCKGGAPGGTTFNPWSMTVVNPPAVYYLNRSATAPTHRVEMIDGQFTIQMRGKSNIDFLVDTLNGGEIRNCSIVVPSVPPTTPFNGNFFQLDVVSWKAL
jgi:hypothetical protein